VKLQDLLPGKTYYFQVVSYDRRGNEGKGEKLTFTTAASGIEGLENVSPQDQGIIETIALRIKQIVDPHSIASVAKVLEQSAQKIVSVPQIIGEKVETEPTRAILPG